VELESATTAQGIESAASTDLQQVSRKKITDRIDSNCVASKYTRQTDNSVILFLQYLLTVYSRGFIL
jgi:hypothetical protein